MPEQRVLMCRSRFVFIGLHVAAPNGILLRYGTGEGTHRDHEIWRVQCRPKLGTRPPFRHPGVLATKVGYFGVKSTNVYRVQMGTKTC